MATIFTHAVAAAAIGSAFAPTVVPRTLWAAGALCAVIPDLDVIGFRFGIHYGDPWGHRGFTHSLCFAALLATAVSALVLVRRPRLGWIWLYLFLATASHGALDALTDGGLGVAFFSPWDQHRYFFPVQPIAVSPIGVGFFSARGLHVIVTEVVLVWAPCMAVICASLWWWRRRPAQPANGRPTPP